MVMTTILQDYMTKVLTDWGVRVKNNEIIFCKTMGHQIEVDQVLLDYDIYIEYWQSGPSGWRSYRTTRKGKLKSKQYNHDIAKTVYYLYHLKKVVLWVDQAYFKMRKDKTGQYILSVEKDKEIKKLFEKQLETISSLFNHNIGLIIFYDYHPSKIYSLTLPKFKRFDWEELETGVIDK